MSTFRTLAFLGMIANDCNLKRAEWEVKWHYHNIEWEEVGATCDADLTCCALERNPSDARRLDQLPPNPSQIFYEQTLFFQRQSVADAEMEKEDMQEERERLVENSLTVDNVKHTQLHIVKAQPVSQVD